MPRGGGGGFRGGGGGGGGFRGGGFRGGSRSFRVGSVRSSGRPFGRTGSRRTVSRSPRSSGRRRSHYGRRHRRHWGGYYRPWYRRWWGWNWWWGYPYRPWYYAPVYWGGGISLGILALLIVPAIMGIALIPYPLSGSNSSGTVTYQDTQTLFYNEYWYENEPMKQGTTIDYNIQAQSEVSFLIWNQPFEELPRTRTLTGSYSEQGMIVQANHDYQYVGYFLNPGSSLTYEFNVTNSGTIEFFVADANELNRWNNWETISPYDPQSVSDSHSNTFTVDYAQDWYLVWYNPTASDIYIDFQVDYIAMNNIDITEADEFVESFTNTGSETFEVPEAGTWYFFIYMDPFVNYEESVDITFEVQFNSDITYDERWSDVTPILLFVGLIVVIVLVIAIVQRRSSKKNQITATTTTTGMTSSTPEDGKKCHRCNTQYKPGETYCTNCGAKLQGRDYGTSTVTTPASSKSCKSCGSSIKPDSSFCRNCGAKIDRTRTLEFSPEDRIAFFCQLDNEQHPSTDSAYKCNQCSRMVCEDCYRNMTKTGVSACPYCKGNLTKVQ